MTDQHASAVLWGSISSVCLLLLTRLFDWISKRSDQQRQAKDAVLKELTFWMDRARAAEANEEHLREKMRENSDPSAMKAEYAKVLTELSDLREKYQDAMSGSIMGGELAARVVRWKANYEAAIDKKDARIADLEGQLQKARRRK